MLIVRITGPFPCPSNCDLSSVLDPSKAFYVCLPSTRAARRGGAQQQVWQWLVRWSVPCVSIQLTLSQQAKQASK